MTSGSTARRVLVVRCLKHSTDAMATRIHSVQRAAYLQEAALLGVVDFAPAQSTTADVQISSDAFYGAFHGEELLGVISLERRVRMKW